jgi:hypothetical protein
MNMKNFVKIGALSTFLLLFLAPSISAVQIGPNVYYYVGNETYSVNQTMNFSQIHIGDTWIKFNNTDFNITSPNAINITLVYINPNIIAASNGDKVLEFYANTTGGKAWFNISGLKPNTDYTVSRGGVLVWAPDASLSGLISLNNSVWSEHSFVVTMSGEDPPDPPDPDPANAAPNVPVSVGNFQCLVTDPDGDIMDVYFYWGTNNTLMGVDTNVPSGSLASISKPSWLQLNTTYYWYANVTDGSFTTRGPVAPNNWSFTTRINHAPDMPVPLPLDSALSVSRTIGQMRVLVTDPDGYDGDTFNVRFYWGDGTLIGSTINVANNTYASVPIPSLIAGKQYFWYVNVTDIGGESTRGPTSGNWSFTIADEGGGSGGGDGDGDGDGDGEEPPVIAGPEVNYGAFILIIVAIVIVVAIAIFYRKPEQSNK